MRPKVIEMDVQHLSMVGTFGAYLVLLLVIGYLGDRRHSKSYEGFVAADKSLGAWTTALSSAASSESAWAMIGLSGLGFFVGLPAMWAAIGCIVGFIVNSLFVIVQLRRDSEKIGAITLSDYIEFKLNDKTRTLRMVSALIITFFMTVYVVAQFVAAGRLMEEMQVLGPSTSYELGVALGATVVGLYIFMGGYAAVCWTDSVQGVLMMLAMIGLPSYACHLAGGFGAVMDSLAAQSTSLATVELLSFGAAGFMAAQMAIGLGYQGMPHMVIRYITVKDTKAARNAALISVAWGAIALTGSAMLGIICRGLYPLDGAGCSASGFCAPTQKAAESILYFFATNELHPIVSGLVLAAVSAAIMSTADSQLMYAATALVNDFWLRLTGANMEAKRNVWVTRAVLVGLTLVAAIVAAREVKLIYSFVLFAWGALGSAFTPVVLLCLYWKRFNQWGALACMIVGPAFSVLWTMPWVKIELLALSPTLYSGAFELIPGCLLSAAAGIITSLTTANPD